MSHGPSLATAPAPAAASDGSAGAPLLGRSVEVSQVLANASPEVLAAVEGIKKGAAKLSMLPDGNPIRAWFESNLAQGEKGVAEIIKGVLSKAKEVKGKDDDFKAEVAKVLEASDYGDIVRAQFPAKPKQAAKKEKKKEQMHRGRGCKRGLGVSKRQEQEGRADTVVAQEAARGGRKVEPLCVLRCRSIDTTWHRSCSLGVTSYTSGPSLAPLHGVDYFCFDCLVVYLLEAPPVERPLRPHNEAVLLAVAVSYTHLRAHETLRYRVFRGGR